MDMTDTLPQAMPIDDLNYTNIPQLTVDHSNADLNRHEWALPQALVNASLWAGSFAGYLLKCAGTDYTPAQMTVLAGVDRLMFDMASGGIKKERVVVPMPTGYGKTTTAIAFMVALHRYGIEDISVAVSSNRIEDLAKIKRDLVRYGGPDILPKIGLLHSNQYDPEKARKYLEGEEPLKKGYSSERAIDTEPTTKQFMLLTHSRLRNSTDDEALDRWNTFNGQTRSIVIYDESLLPADVMSFDLKSFSTQVGAHGGSLKYGEDGTDITVQRERYEWLRKVDELFESAAPTTRNGAPVVVQIPTLSEEKVAAFKAAPYLTVKDHPTLDACIDFAGASVRLIKGQGQYLATYEVVVHPMLKRVVILDASYPIRSLARHPSTISIHNLRGWYSKALSPYMGDEPTKMMKDHREVIVAIMEGGWGKSGVQADIDKGATGRSNPKSKLVNDVVQVIKRVVSPYESVLVFTYKGDTDSGGIDQGKMLKTALTKEGIDVDAVMPNGKRRINITTWGNETGTNEFAHCEHVILAGVLQLPEHALAGGYLASQDDLAAEVESEMSRIKTSEGAHLIYQALSRGASRRTRAEQVKVDGPRFPAAGKMTAWIVVPEKMRKQVSKHLQTVMPGVRFADWHGSYGGGKKPERAVSGAVKAIRVILAEQAAEGVEKVSSRRLKGLMPADLKNTASRSWARAVQEVSEDPQIPWELTGSSLVRMGPGYLGQDAYGFGD
jgi:hypothetical protein